MPIAYSCRCQYVRIVWGLFCAVLLPVCAARAQVQVDAIVTPLGGSFQYDITVHNSGPDEVVVVSVLDGPFADPLINPSLITPSGFQASYDGGLGIVDLLADSNSFLSGTSVSGFRFESLGLPGTSFSAFEALDSFGGIQQGNVNFTVVPEARTVVPGLGVGGLAVLQLLRRRRSRP